MTSASTPRARLPAIDPARQAARRRAAAQPVSAARSAVRSSATSCSSSAPTRAPGRARRRQTTSPTCRRGDAGGRLHDVRLAGVQRRPPVTLGAVASSTIASTRRVQSGGAESRRQLPTTTDPCGEITFSQPDDRDEGQAVGRVDYQLERQPYGVRPLHGDTRREAVGVRASPSNVLTTS